MPFEQTATVAWSGDIFRFSDQVSLVIPAIALGDLEQLMPDGIKGAPTPKLTIDLAHAALRRNYPQITREEVGGLIDMRNMMAVWQCVMAVSGLTRRGTAAEAAPGEAQAPSTGASSMQS